MRGAAQRTRTHAQAGLSNASASYFAFISLFFLAFATGALWLPSSIDRAAPPAGAKHATVEMQPSQPLAPATPRESAAEGAGATPPARRATVRLLAPLSRARRGSRSFRRLEDLGGDG